MVQPNRVLINGLELTALGDVGPVLLTTVLISTYEGSGRRL